MPCEYQLAELEQSLFDMAQSNEGYFGLMVNTPYLLSKDLD